MTFLVRGTRTTLISYDKGMWTATTSQTFYGLLEKLEFSPDCHSGDFTGSSPVQTELKWVWCYKLYTKHTLRPGEPQ